MAKSGPKRKKKQSTKKKREKKKANASILQRAYLSCFLLVGAILCFAYYKESDELNSLALPRHSEATEAQMEINRVIPPIGLRGAQPAPVPVFEPPAGTPLARIVWLEAKILFQRENTGGVLPRLQHLEKVAFSRGHTHQGKKHLQLANRIERLEQFVQKKKWGKPYAHHRGHPPGPATGEAHPPPPAP
jgi:hypothetical protein